LLIPCFLISPCLFSISRIVVKPAPCDFIETFIGGSDYWANGIRKEYRTTNPDQIAFCDTFKAIIVELGNYVKEYHRTGLAWNKSGIDVSEYKDSGSSSAAPAASAAPAKPAASSAAPAATSSSASSSAPKGNLFAELNKDAAITSGLKKVTKDMQTWRTEYKGEPVAPAAKAPPAAAPSKAALANQVKGPPKLEYQDVGSKWVVENQTSSVDIEIKDKKETVYVFGCIGATINVKGKCKSIVIDNCKKTTLFFEVAMASVEVVNCQRMNVHCLNTVAAVAIDKTDGIVVHLPPSSLTTEIVASKSSEMNVSFPDPNNPEECIERPIPEQYVHRIKGNQITADVSDLYSH
jgi:adenylyl cyclase-associated protein